MVADHNIELPAHSPGGQSKIKVPAGPAPSEGARGESVLAFSFLVVPGVPELMIPRHCYLGLRTALFPVSESELPFPFS